MTAPVKPGKRKVPREWVIYDEDARQIIRGPYRLSETAAAVRTEIELQTQTDHNLLILTKANAELSITEANDVIYRTS